MDPGQIQGVKSCYTKKIVKQISIKSFTSVIAQIDKEKKKILFVALPALTSPQKLVLILLCYGILRIRREVANPDPVGSHRALIFFSRATTIHPLHHLSGYSPLGWKRKMGDFRVPCETIKVYK